MKRRLVRLYPVDPGPTGDELKAQGMALALNGASEWKDKAYIFIRSCPEGMELTSENVTAACGLPTGKVGTNKNNAVGGVMSGAGRKGYLVFVRYEKPKRSVLHSSPVSVWRRTRLR